MVDIYPYKLYVHWGGHHNLESVLLSCPFLPSHRFILKIYCLNTDVSLTTLPLKVPTPLLCYQNKFKCFITNTLGGFGFLGSLRYPKDPWVLNRI